MPLSVEVIVDKLKTIIEEVSLGNLIAENIDSNAKIIEDLGLDSLDYASVLLACEQWLQIKVQEKDVDWRLIQTVRELANFMGQQQ